MQIFLAYPNIPLSIECLDKKRKGKQRVEAKQVLRMINDDRRKWPQFPLVKMWSGYATCLEYYYNECILQWKEKGGKNTLLLRAFERGFNFENIEYPPWFGNEEYHASQRAALLFKGWMDETCKAIPTRKANIWLLANGFPEKHKIKTLDILFAIQDKLGHYPALEDTHYAQFGWKEEPRIDYIWPYESK